jgi:ATP-binding cassette subfamily B protein
VTAYGILARRWHVKQRDPQELSTWFAKEWRLLAAVSITGVIYNVGLGAGPWLEGQLAQAVANLADGSGASATIAWLSLAYVLTTALVQAMRYLKRLYVRKFANKISRGMKERIYAGLLADTSGALASQGAGTVMTKAISDVDDCVEGMRKFTTELFDTGVALATYLVMLLVLDWRLTLVSLVFPAVSYVVAASLRQRVTRATALAKQSSGVLKEVTLERTSGAVTLRAFGAEAHENRLMEDRLMDYRRKATAAGILSGSLQPLYLAISTVSCGFILYLGGRNVLGLGWTAWDVAALSTFFATYLRLARKSSTAAKLFNAVQRARVSWERIRPFMGRQADNSAEQRVARPATLELRNVSVFRHDGRPVLRDVCLTVQPGQIVGVTGEVASGKTLLGLAMAELVPHTGQALFDGQPLASLQSQEVGVVGYLGHDPELLSDTIEENVRLGQPGDATEALTCAALGPDLAQMPDGAATRIGEGGAALSGGQRARVGLARTLFNRRPVLVLDDPFSSVDPRTERQVLKALRQHYSDCAIVLISHRLECFPLLDQVVYLHDGCATVATHKQLLDTQPGYRELFDLQQGGDLDA